MIFTMESPGLCFGLHICVLLFCFVTKNASTMDTSITADDDDLMQISRETKRKDFNFSSVSKSRHRHDRRMRRKMMHKITDDDIDELDVSPEKILTKYLIRRYARVGIGGRPLTNTSAVLMVKFGLAVIQMDLDEKNNMLTTSAWCRIRWEDEYLKWDPADFGGVRSIRLSSKKIWIPDIMLYNTADTQKLERDVLAVVHYDGSILWIPHRIYRSSCSIDVTNYPFDKQRCDMTFGSWAYHGNEIDLGFYSDMEMLDISDLERESTEWEITYKSESRRIQYYDCCEDPYVTLTFSLEMKRKLVFSSFILTLPCIFLACMTLVVFWLPPERPDRTSLVMSMFSSFLFLLLILVEVTPSTTSSVPTLGLYYCFNMVIIMLSIFLSSVVINISRRGDSLEPVPNWLRTISLRCLSKVFCVTMTKRARTFLRDRATKRMANARSQAAHAHDESSQMLHQDIVTSHVTQSMRLNGTSDITTNVPPPLPPFLGEENVEQQHSGSNELKVDRQALKSLHNHFLYLDRNLRSIEGNVNDMLALLREKDVTRETRELKFEWHIVAMTLDRLFFVLFIVAIITSLITLFPRPYALQLNL